MTLHLFLDETENKNQTFSQRQRQNILYVKNMIQGWSYFEISDKSDLSKRSY